MLYEVITVATSYETDHPFQLTPGWLMPFNRVVPPVAGTKSMRNNFV